MDGDGGVGEGERVCGKGGVWGVGGGLLDQAEGVVKRENYHVELS